jgi:hypothetical protein
MSACGCCALGQNASAEEQPAEQVPSVQDAAKSDSAVSSGELATTMVLRGAVGTLIGAAASPAGQEGIWGALGFVMGATLGEIGIVGVALAALWRKGGS